MCSYTHVYTKCLFSEEKEKTACGDPPIIENGTANLDSTIYYNGDKVAYECKSGYHLRGSTEITCKRGKWTRPPECVGVYATFTSNS